MASEAVGGNMPMNTRVIKVADVKSEVIRPPRSFGGRWRQYAHGYQGPNSIGKKPIEKPTEKPTETPTEIPYTKKRSKNG